MNEEERVPKQFCGGKHFPITCAQHSVSDTNEVVDQILLANNDLRREMTNQMIVRYNPIFISDGDHKDLMMKLRDHPLLFSFNRVWVIPIEYAPMMPLRLDNNIIFYEYVNGGYFSIYDSYAIKGKNSITTRLFQWPNENTSPRILNRVLEGRSNLNGVVLKHPQVRNRQNMLNRRWEDCLLALQSKLNFTLQKINNEDRRWGSKHENGTWNGVIGLLLADEIDLVVGLMANIPRQEVIDFCWPTDGITITLMIRKEGSPKVNFLAYVVFPWNAWIVGLGTLIVLALCLAISAEVSVVQGFTLVMRLFLQIGYDLSFKGIASRTLLMTAALCLNLLFIYYTMDLTATMTAGPPEVDIRSFEDAERLGYDVAIITGSGTMPYNLLKSAPNESAMQRVYKDAKYITRETNEELLRLIKGESKTLAFHYSSRFHKEVIKMDIIEATTLRQSISFQKDSEFFALFTHNIFKMQEIGLVGRIKNKHSVDPDTEYGMSEPIVLGYENIIFPFSWLALGIMIALALLVVEVGGRWLKTLKYNAT